MRHVIDVYWQRLARRLERVDLLPLGSDGGSFEGGQVGRQRLARRLERVDLRPPLLADQAAHRHRAARLLRRQVTS